MYMRALAGYEKALGSDHTSTLDTVNNLGTLYGDQDKLAEAEQMYLRALAGSLASVTWVTGLLKVRSTTNKSYTLTGNSLCWTSYSVEYFDL
jgi:hypothetical protein